MKKKTATAEEIGARKKRQDREQYVKNKAARDVVARNRIKAEQEKTKNGHNAGERWTKEQDEKLNQQKTDVDIALEIGRAVMSVRVRRSRLSKLNDRMS